MLPDDCLTAAYRLGIRTYISRTDSFDGAMGRIVGGGSTSPRPAQPEPPGKPLAPIAGGSQSILKWEVDEAPDATVVRLIGEVDLGNADQLEHLLDAAFARGVHLIVDLTKLSYVDTTGWHVFVNCDTRLKHGGRRLVLCCLAPTIRKVFEIVGLDKLIPAPASLDDARRMVRGER